MLRMFSTLVWGQLASGSERVQTPRPLTVLALARQGQERAVDAEMVSLWALLIAICL
jgi:hypothetical protein